MNKTPIIILTLLLFLIPSVTADPEQYLMAGVTRDSSHQQDGTGLWTGRTPVQYTRTHNMQSTFPVVGDVDDDGNNEIIIIGDNNLQILNYTVGVGIISEQEVSHGSTSASTTKFYVTPALFDTDNDGTYEIISSNITHMLMYSWNGTEIVLNQSAATLMNVATTVNPAFTHPVIKCAQGSQWSTGKDTCIIPLSNRSGAVGYTTIIAYNTDDNTVVGKMGATGNSNTDNNIKNTHLADGDGDGYLEAYFQREDLANGYTMVYKIEVSTSLTVTELLTHDLDANEDHTDIIVNDMTGNGGELEISFGYTDDDTNYDAATYNANTGALIDASYCTLTTCPEGNMPSDNMFIPSDTTYTSYTGDVCYYIRNYEESDPGSNIDSVFCISRYAGAGYTETEVANTANFTNRPVVHDASLHGSAGLLTPKFTIQGGTKQSLPSLNGERVIIPVDVSESGSLDLIGLSTTTLTYYDDAYTNQNWEVDSIEWDTGNPVCENEIVTFTVSITDNETDFGRCFITEKYGNDTLIANTTNVTGTPPVSLSMNYFADSVGTFLLDFYCFDQYHDMYDANVQTYTVQVSNDTTVCLIKGEGGGSEEYISDEEAAEDAQFDRNVDDVFGDIGIVSDKAKSMFWLLIMIAVAFVIFKLMAGAEGMVWVLAVVEVMMLVLGWTLGMIGATVLVIVGLLCALLITLMVFKGKE